MNISYQDGAMVVTAKYYERVLYDVSNNCLSAELNGLGGITKYMVVNDAVKYQHAYAGLKFQVNGRDIPFLSEKTVTMAGRIQEYAFSCANVHISVATFVDRDSACIFQKLRFESSVPAHVSANVFMRGAISADFQKTSEKVAESPQFLIASDHEIQAFPENENVSLFEGCIDGKEEVGIVYSFGNPDASSLAEKCISKYQEMKEEISAVKIPGSCTTEELKALYLSAYFCALENYKTLGGFEGFMAGCNYLAPARTYFRDSYYTVLSMYNGNTDKVRHEILTLSRCVREDGSCPSAVKSDFTEFWGRHFDSPSLYCMQIYDYVKNTGDRSILSETVNGSTIEALFERVIRFLLSLTDETGLLLKKGPMNRLDWADEVNRYGYVAYDNLLFARALCCASKLLQKDSEFYQAAYVRTVKAIDEILWDEKRGYYVNFKNEDYIEDNLSIDTVFAVIFNIADEEKSERILSNCQKLLESRSHADLEDFGTMSVWPPYKNMQAGLNKSAFPLDYHNGADWPYLSAMYAYALKCAGKDYRYPLAKWFSYNQERGHFTPVEYYSPYCPTGSSLQAWSSAAAFVLWDEKGNFFA